MQDAKAGKDEQNREGLVVSQSERNGANVAVEKNVLADAIAEVVQIGDPKKKPAEKHQVLANSPTEQPYDEGCKLRPRCGHGIASGEAIVYFFF